MPFAFIFVGILLLVSGVRGTNDDLVTLVKGDITSGYFQWMLAILAVGALGYVDSLRGFSRTFLFLIIVGLILSKRGIFTQLTSAINAPSQTGV